MWSARERISFENATGAGSIVNRDIFACMTKPKLTYFDAPVSRGEECRLALHLAGIDFEDARIKGPAWPAMKEQTPYGGLPVLELPGQPPLAHSNAILVLIGRAMAFIPPTTSKRRGTKA